MFEWVAEATNLSADLRLMFCELQRRSGHNVCGRLKDRVVVAAFSRMAADLERVDTGRNVPLPGLPINGIWKDDF